MIPNKNKEQIKIIEVSRDGRIKIDKQDQYRDRLLENKLLLV